MRPIEEDRHYLLRTPVNVIELKTRFHEPAGVWLLVDLKKNPRFMLGEQGELLPLVRDRELFSYRTDPGNIQYTLDHLHELAEKP